ncbi:MAG: KdsC family phosphatase [Clostridiales bacterium]
MGNYNKLADFDFRKIKLVLTDIDGVWTDGGLFYSSEGMVMKRFNVKDGMGVNRLRDRGIETGIVSGDTSDIITARGLRLKLDLIYIGIADKKQALDEICQKRNLCYENIAFIGDDVNDITMIENVGLSAAPADAVPEIIEMVDYRCQKKGGDACFREFIEMIIRNIDKQIVSEKQGVQSL